MFLANLTINSKQVWTLTLLMGLGLLSASSVKAMGITEVGAIGSPVPSNSQPATLESPLTRPMLLADAICGYQGGSIRSFETTNYRVYICLRDGKKFYVGLEKGNEGNQNIYLPVRSPDRDTYVAVNGEYSYTINSRELVVRRNGKVLGRERVLRSGN